MNRHSGQALMITIFVLLTLLISVPAMVYVTQISGRHGVISQKKQKARSVALQGIDYATQVLSQADFANWPPTGGNVPAAFIGGNTSFLVADGSFTITEQAGTPAYQVILYSKGYSGSESAEYQAILSQKTLGVASPNGTSGALALQLMKAPSLLGTGTLDVQWGPVGVFDGAAVWTLKNPMDNGQYPRKFAMNGIVGTTFLRTNAVPPLNSDNKEYWAFAGLGAPPPQINLNFYQTQAQAHNGYAPSPILAASLAHPPVGLPLNPTPAISTYFNTQGGVGAVAVFDDDILPDGYTLHSTSTTIYVDGDVEFECLSLQLGPVGAMVVSGNLTIGPHRNPSGQQIANEYVPPTAASEYPYGTAWPPCQNQQGNMCAVNWNSPTDRVQYKGFLYVLGNLVVQAGVSAHLVGAVRVDGQLIINNGSSLTIHYDDVINHYIQTSSLQVQTESLKEIPLQ